MTKEEAIQFYKEYCDKCNAYNLALTTMYFDMSTIAPEAGSDYRIKVLSFLGGELFDYQTNPENIKKIDEISALRYSTMIMAPKKVRGARNRSRIEA